MFWVIGPTIPRLLYPVVGEFSAITCFPFAFAEQAPQQSTVVHEYIHARQSLDSLLVLAPMLGALGLWQAWPGWVMLLVPVAAILAHGLLYTALSVVGRIIWLSRGSSWAEAGHLGYRSNPMEIEAYGNSRDIWPDGEKRASPRYLATRRPFTWVSYLRDCWWLI